MKYLFFSFLPLFSLAQPKNDMGTIHVDMNNTATLQFHQPIDWVVVGNNPQVSETSFLYYDLFQDKSVVVIRANKTDSPVTSVTVSLVNGDVYFGKLSIGTPDRIYFFFGPLKQEEPVKTADSSADPMLDNRILQMMSFKPKYRTFGKIMAGIEFLVSDVMNDERFTYFKIEINNGSSTDYSIDGILFKYVQGKRVGLKRKEAAVEERLIPRKTEGPTLVKSYSREKIVVAIPLFSVNTNGELLINIRESRGTRNVEISLSGNDLLSVSVF